MTDEKEPRAQQLALDLPVETSFDEADFLRSPANQRAYDLVAGWPNWASPVMLLVGPEGSGKTHLSHIWAKKSGARFTNTNDLSIDTIEASLATGCVVLEAAHRKSLDQVALFHLINAAREDGGYLMITARDWPSVWPVTLPDLASRLRAAVPAELGEPDDELLKAVLTKNFSDRQLNVDQSVIQYLATRMERSLRSVATITEKLDQMSLSQKRPITKALAAKALESDLET